MTRSLTVVKTRPRSYVSDTSCDVSDTRAERFDCPVREHDSPFTVINAGWIMTKAHDSVDIVTRERSDPNDMMSVRRTLPAKFLSLLK